jgi:predicted nucleic acid-binding protein
MSGASFLLDTNVVLYLLSGNSTIADTIDGAQIYVSFVTELELLGYKGITAKEQQKIKLFLNDCTIIDINDDIKKNTIAIKQKHQTKLPDAIIAATSLFTEIPLLTADVGFSKIGLIDVILYQE